MGEGWDLLHQWKAGGGEEGSQEDKVEKHLQTGLLLRTAMHGDSVIWTRGCHLCNPDFSLQSVGKPFLG